jgi:RNA polymerase sigma-70 factor (ECF subfamily)
MDPFLAPVEAVEAGSAQRAVAADETVVDAWAQHHEALFSYLVRTTRDPEAAEDLLQEAFLRLTTETRAGRSPANVHAWLFRVATNLAVSRGRRIATAFRALARLRPVSAAARPEESPETVAITLESRNRLVATLGQLGPDARAAILLSSQGFSSLDIAAAIGRSDAATRTLLCRSRLQVRRLLEAEEAVR